jgi:hypothetical protein
VKGKIDPIGYGAQITIVDGTVKTTIGALEYDPGYTPISEKDAVELLRKYVFPETIVYGSDTETGRRTFVYKPPLAKKKQCP